MKTMLFAAAIAAAALPGQSRSQMMPPAPSRIMTSGEGQTRVSPDRATVMIGVQTRALTAAAAGADNAKRQKAVLDTLKALGIPPEQLMTQNFSVSPEMRYDPAGGNPKVTGYTVSNTVRVELKKVEQVGAVIDAALAKGANQITGVQFSASNYADARRTAMAEAVRNARADAEALARAAGGTLGPLLEMTSSGPIYRPMNESFAMAGAAMKTATPIETGEQIITANVSATWQFIPGSGT